MCYTQERIIINAGGDVYMLRVISINVNANNEIIHARDDARHGKKFRERARFPLQQTARNITDR